MVQCSGPTVVWTVTWAPGRRSRTPYRAPGPTPARSTWPSTTNSAEDGIHQPTSSGTPRVPAAADSGDADADTRRLGIWSDWAPTGSTAGMAGAGGSDGRLA